MLVLAGCSEPAPELREVRISGSARLADGSTPQGTVHVLAYHAWSGEGPLRHPLKELGGFTGPAAAFSGAVSHEAGGGEGLIVYGWLDIDGDGVHCTPAQRGEPAGLVVVEPFPVEEVAVNLALTENCQGPNWFFPPAAAGQ
jgi:hypothetical protein